MAAEFHSVGVVGLGTMGAGIVEVFARAGLQVVGMEPAQELLARGRGHLQHSTDRAVSRGRLTHEDRDALHARVRFSTSMDDLADVDLVIEAVPERLELKREIFAAADKVCRPDAILATNTSSLPVTAIAMATQRPSRVVGMHFFNPAPVLKLVEVVRTVVTDPDVVEDVAALAQRLDKVPVVIGDKAGFIANALLFGYLNHASSMYESHDVSREDLDAAMTLGCGYPMGPLALLDLIGLDTANEILDTMYRQSRDRLHAPAPILKQMVTAGLLGRKTGRGFYTYAEPNSPKVVPDELTGRHDRLDVVSPRPVHSVGVVGSGTMAAGIVEVLSNGGYDVRYVERGPDEVGGVAGLDGLAACDLVIEAVVGEPSVNQALFTTLDEVCRPGAVLATTTASVPVIEMASGTGRPGDVVGMHFFDPAPETGLVEVVRTVCTGDDVVATARAVTRQIGKRPVTCGDRAGFVVDALLFPYLNDAVKMLQEHYATVEDIDNAMVLGCGYPMGPFQVLDAIGLDVALANVRRLYRESREPGLAPARLLEQLVTAGHLGRKTGRGFRDHSEGS